MSSTHFRLSPNSFEIRLHDSTPCQKYQAKDRVRGSGHRKWLYLSRHVVVRLRRETGLSFETCTIVPSFRECKRVPNVTGHTLFLTRTVSPIAKDCGAKEVAGSQRTR